MTLLFCVNFEGKLTQVQIMVEKMMTTPIKGGTISLPILKRYVRRCFMRAMNLIKV